MLFCGFVVCLRKSAGSAGDIGVYSVRIDWVLLRVILPQIAQITQTNAASCIITQRKTDRGSDEIATVLIQMYNAKNML